jgi:hypothetical protein
MDDLSKINRNELEKFIREQMVGPNGCNDKFSYAQETERGCYEGEIINTTPGSIYSTAILFPKKKDTPEALNIDSTAKDTIDEADNYSESEEYMTITDETEQNGGIGCDIDDEDVYSLNRRFPNTIGISCCLRPETNINKDVHIYVSGRYYTKIKDSDRRNIQVNVKDNKEEFEQFFNENTCLHEYFKYEYGKLSVFCLNKQQISAAHELLRTINFRCAYKVANESDKLDENYDSIDKNFRFLLSYRERSFSKLIKVNDGQYITDEEKNILVKRIKEIEMYETFMSYFDDLMELFDRKSFGFWMSHNFKKAIDLSSLIIKKEGKKRIYKPSECPCLSKVVSFEINKDKQISLSLWLQQTYSSKDSNDKNIYLKVLLENTATPFTEDKQNYFSIVNEKVNQSCFFGIRIDIESDYLEQYREDGVYKDPSKEQDRLNFLYRRIKDYAVGHLCSADWDKDNNGKVYRVFTEFLPSYETPDIEPVPRNKYEEYVEENGELVPPPYLCDNQCLQFKWLSTLSDAQDSVIIDSLNQFVNIYGNWISKLQTEIDDKDKDFAETNLSACRKDYERMRKNIKSILCDTNSLLAFRLMNTAMFMQLWHNKSENQKLLREKGPKLNEGFYRNANDNIFLEQTTQHGVLSSWPLFCLI